MTCHPRSKAFIPIVLVSYALFLISAGCGGSRPLSSSAQSGESGGDGITFPGGGSADNGPGVGDGTLGAVDYAGNGNQLPTADEQNAFAGLAQQVKAVSPQAVTAFTPDVIAGLQSVQSMEAKGEDTTAARMALAGKILNLCAQDVTRLAPRPGEPLLGGWIGACTSGDSVVLAASVTAQYPASSGGQPAGNPKLSIVSIGSNGDAAAGNIKVYPDGTADAIVQASSTTWTGKLTDQPQAATGVFVPVSGNSKCKQIQGQLAKSKNPIPGKYQEAVKRLGQCYRQALTVVSPILSGYLYNLTSSSANAVVGALQLQ